MEYRTPENVKKEFKAHRRRALIITTVDHESRAVKAHIPDLEILSGKKGIFYEFGRFSDPAGDWLIVHVITAQGNTDASLIATGAHQEFGSFEAQIFVGVAGSLKEDIQIGSVVIGDYVYNGHSAKVEDTKTLSRPRSLVPAQALLSAARILVYRGEWINLIRAPHPMELPKGVDYPCVFPPKAVIKGIVSGEEVVAGEKSERYVWLRSHFNDCGAVEMEGWGAMKAAYYENTPAIIVRGISDMCAGKDHAKDNLHQPIAAAHAAAFAFSILSFMSKVPAAEGPVVVDETKGSEAAEANESPPPEERRVEFVFNFEGSKEEWPEEKVKLVIERFKREMDDEKLTLVRIEGGSIRLVMSVRESDLAVIDLEKLREAAAHSGATLLGAIPLEAAREAEKAKEAIAAASVNLFAWEKTLPGGKWMERPERDRIEARFHIDTSSTVLLGEPGTGKSALLSKIASDLIDRGAAVFALKADFLSTDVRTETDLQRELQLSALPSELILCLAALQPVFVFIDQLDALASQLDLRTGRLNVLLNLVRCIGGTHNVHILLSARTFEFNHDVRLRAVEAEGVTLALPPWHEVKERLVEVGIAPDTWPEEARDVVRIPQALKTFIALVGAGRNEPLTTYQAMLEQLWRDRLATADNSDSLIALASDLAGKMAEEEALWLAASRFDDRLNALKRLEALGFIVRSENNLSIAFSHQTIFDYVLARTFVGSAGLLSTYVIERQDSLFVRAKLWSALNYLREAEARSYERELLEIWKTKDLRSHLRLLLIEFLGQVSQPLEFEKACLAEVIDTPELRIFGLKAIGSRPDWFVPFASTAVRDAMSGTNAEAGQALRVLSLNWKTDSDLVIRLIKERWLPYPERDSYSWMAIHECPLWTDEVEAIATAILKRSPISLRQVDNTAGTVAVEQPDVAMRLVLAKLNFLFAEAKGKPEPPPFPTNGTEDEKTSWHTKHYRRSKEFNRLLDTVELYYLPSIAEAGPTVFLRYLWSWYVSVFSEIIARSKSRGDKHIYDGKYLIEIELTSSEDRPASREKPVMSALQIAVEELAEKTPDEFSTWADENSTFEMLAVQQLIARGYEVGAERLASKALEWILLDQRRFQLVSRYGHQDITINLVRASAPYWSNEEISRFEKAALGYRPPFPEHLKEPDQRRRFDKFVRATRKNLLQAVGVERLSPENRKLVATEQRALGDRLDRSISEVRGGLIGSPLEDEKMAKAKDRDILKIFREIPDNTNWEHPTQWMRGGNIQLSRSFSKFARSDPERAIRLMEQFEPHQQERAAGYALDAMADDAPNDSYVIDALIDLHTRGFQAEEFRESAAHAIEKIADRKADISGEVIDIFVGWLNLSPAPSKEDVEKDSDLISRMKDKEFTEGSILWSGGHSVLLPGGNFNILSSLASILLNRGEAGRDHYLAILNDHLSRERDPNIWKALLFNLSNAGGSTPQIVSTFIRKLFSIFPKILATRETVMFLAYAQRWDDQLVLDLISGWHKSNQVFLQRAYGELVGLVATVKEKDDWTQARDEIMSSGTDDVKIGLAHAGVNMWLDEKLRQRAGETLVTLLKGASKELVATVMDVFRVTTELTPDTTTVELLRALADADTDMSAAPSHFVVERLQTILPHEPKLIATIAEKLVAAWRGELGDMRTGTITAAPQLIDLALTLHRMGGASRQSGVAIFEAMIEIDAYGARETLSEIDGRFGLQQTVARQRLARRRKPRSRRR